MAFRLPRLQRNIALVDTNGLPTAVFQQWWQLFIEQIEQQEAAQDAIIAQVQANQLEIIATQEELVTAQADIVAAQAELAEQLALIIAAQVTADAVTRTNAISASWISPTSVLTAVDAGLDATITVADFTRIYDDGTSVAVTGGDLTELAYATEYAVYYDDVTRQDNDPILVATTDTATARHNYVSGRHYVDAITTPASGGGGTSGGGYTPPGGGNPGGYFPPPES